MKTKPKEEADGENIQGKYENGLLHLLVPEKEESKQKPPKQIQF